MANKTETTNWFDNIKETLNLKECIKKYDLTTCKIIEIVSYFGIGFFVGFLIKRHAKTIIFGLIFACIALYLLDNFNIVSIDWTKLRAITGVNPNDTIGTLSTTYFQWIKDNVVIVVSALVGFLIGYKIG